jgi:hypothetical protein
MNETFIFGEEFALNSNRNMKIIMGGLTLKAFVVASHKLTVIGIVRFGMEYGLLASTPNGHYVRVNGSKIQALPDLEVHAAISRARCTGRGESFKASRDAELDAMPRPATAIVRKRHRHIDPQLAANNSHLQPLAA